MLNLSVAKKWFLLNVSSGIDCCHVYNFAGSEVTKQEREEKNISRVANCEFQNR